MVQERMKILGFHKKESQEDNKQLTVELNEPDDEVRDLGELCKKLGIDYPEEWRKEY